MGVIATVELYLETGVDGASSAIDETLRQQLRTHQAGSALVAYRERSIRVGHAPLQSLTWKGLAPSDGPGAAESSTGEEDVEDIIRSARAYPPL